MDNESFGMQKLKNYLRARCYDLQYLGKKVYSIEAGSSILKEYLELNEPFMFCRVGATEGRVIDKWMSGKKYSEKDIENIKTLSGVFPNDKRSLDRFCETYINGITEADGLFTWGCVGEAKAVKKYASRDIKLLRNDTYNVLFYPEPWTLALEGKKVLVIHPFIDTIKMQYQIKDKLFVNKILPEFKSLSCIRAIQTSAGEEKEGNYKSWFDALDYMKKQISTVDFDVALIGAGAYGIPLASYVKSIGKQAIHMAGNLQILFGIRGKRWDNFPQYVQYFNEYWVYPAEHETPKNKGSVEGGSYWR